MDILAKTNSFMKDANMHFRDIDMEDSVFTFMEEMKKGLRGEASSLLMLPTYIETGIPVPINEPAIVLDAGGSNFRTALIKFDEQNRPVVDFFRKTQMPGIDKEVSKAEFFARLVSQLELVGKHSSKVGFCFSYPAEINEQRDGRLLALSKEVQAPGVVGCFVGAELLATMEKYGYPSNYKIAVFNDTVTSLLAGKMMTTNRNFSGHIGFILGTGTNCAYEENNTNITKNRNLDLSKKQVINMETGAYDKQKRGVVDIIIDGESQRPGSYTFEKMISGAYLGKLAGRTLIEAANRNLFSQKAGVVLEKIGRKLSTEDLSKFLSAPTVSSPLCEALFTHEDYTVAYVICSNIIERAAKLCAVNICSAIMKSDMGRNPLEPICITVDGTTFYAMEGLLDRVKSYMMAYLSGDKRRYFVMTRVEDACLIGAAVAALTNLK